MKKTLISLFASLSLLIICGRAQNTQAGSSQLGNSSENPSTRITGTPWNGSTNDFEFPGGTLGDFGKAIQNAFGFDLIKEASVSSFYSVQIRVPKIKFSKATGSVMPSVHMVLMAYNALEEGGLKGLGKWVMPARTDTIAFVPPKADELNLKKNIQVYSLAAGTTAAQRKMLEQAIETALALYQETNKFKPGGQFRFHQPASLLIAVGDDAYLSVVSEVVKALKDSAMFRLGAMTPPKPVEKPN